MANNYERLDARLIDGSDNNVIYPTAGTTQQPFLRAISSTNFNQDSSPVTSPTDFLGLNPNGSTTIKCTDKVPTGMYPMPRCISNIMCSYHTQLYDVNTLSSYRSFRRTSHFVTFFGQYIVADITISRSSNPTYPVFLPADDPLYNPIPNSTVSPYQINVPFLPANRSDGNNDTNPTTRNPLLSGENLVTPFLDLNNIYGISDQDAIGRLRDTSSNRGKLKTSIINGEHYPPKNASNGKYIWGSTSDRSYNIFVLAIQTIWIREHNRLCDELYQKYGNSWTDEQYFQEARRWVIAFFQKTVAEEYIGAVLGRPLPVYQKYNPNLKPGIDTFFSTVTFRYGHSELRIQDEYGDTLYDLVLNDLKNLTLLEQLGLERVLWSLVLQRQEEVDIFLSDSTKKYIAPDLVTYDIAAFDILRSRDRGIPLYNVVRQYFGFPKAKSFADISTNHNVQANLAKIYPNGVDSVEAWVGVMSEDHLNGSNFGMVMNASMVTQNPDMFNSDEQKIIRNTTFRDIIIRNLNKSVNFPQNIWAVQPQMKLNNSDDDNYPNKISSWTQYIISYRIDLAYVYFKVQLQTSDGNGWFGMGFGPDDDGMKGAEFIIGIVTNGNVTLENYYADVGGYHPPLRDSNQDPDLVPKFSMSDSKAVTVEFKRLLRPPGRKPITNDDMKCHFNMYLKIHKFIQLVGGISISAFGFAAISTVIKTQTPHAWMGLFIFAISFIEIGLGLIAVWGQTSVISVNKELIPFVFPMANKAIIERKVMMHAYINYEDYAKLPEFTWEEINERVQRGAYLVVCDGLVVDILDWTYSHPGGRKILVNVIGTDITDDFYNTHQNTQISEEIDSPEALLIPKDNFSGNFSSVLTKYISHLQREQIPQKLSTIPKLIDNINKMYYLKAPLAQHTHSRFATQKMASMVIGKVVEKPLAQNDKSTFSEIHESEKSSVEYNKTSTSTIKNIQFHRYKLTSKVMVNANIKYPVIRFTFSRVHQDKKNVNNQKFLPGDYIEMQSRVKGQNVIRSYTPIQGSLFKSFSIYVKIYPYGLFSQHLNEQLIGYEIQVRGPFDVYNRPKPCLMSLNSTQYFNWGAGFFSPMSPYNIPIGPPRISSPMKTSLLNPNSSDGCWNELYMIAAERNNDFEQNVNSKRMHLLFGNRKIEDIIDGILLEDLALSSRGQFTVTYCLSDPPSDWVGFEGKISQQVIQNWMNIMRGENMSQPCSESNDYTHIQDHYILYNSNEHNKSPSPEISSRSQSPCEISQNSPLLSYRTTDAQSSEVEPKSRKINASTERSRIPKKINLDLVAPMKWNNVMQGKIFVCGPTSMMIAVEKALLNMGYNEQNITTLY
ncbi:19835_t:CDS:10 [Cetraspora pellucida]|uniref:19835_t:CDS:1 n=1 Tax=Cetraspora pellucida TaxID=1433469 RepID=A0A9N9FSM1_9GLOM|nr:19835_t:CDS:10 [Cetraspora pellucida]